MMKDQDPLNKSAAADPTADPPKPAEEARRMEAVRDLLFGRQMDAMNQSVHGLEEKLASAMNSGRQSLERKIDSLESFTRDEVNSVRDALSREESERDRGESEARGRMDSLETELAAKARRFSEDLSRLEKTMHDRFLEQNKRFSEKLEEAMGELRDELKREVKSLQDVKTSRSSLGDMMIDMGMRLQGGETDELPPRQAAPAEETLSN